MRRRVVRLLMLIALPTACREGSQQGAGATSRPGASIATRGGAASSATTAQTASSPRIVQTDSGPVALLPDVMIQALRRSYPYFRLRSWTTYPDSVRAAYHPSDTDGIRVIVGDFNGDGKLDVALDGTDTVAYRVGGRRGGTTIAILTSGDSAVAMTVLESEFPSDAAHVTRWLRPVGAGKFRTELTTDAIGVPTLTEPGSELRPYQVYWFVPRWQRFAQWSDGE